MMETRGTTLKMNQPRPLEATCKSSDFKPWWGLLTSFLDQDLSHEQFLPGGRYESWNSSTSSPRGTRGRLTTLFVRQATSPEHLIADDEFTVAQVRSVAIKEDPTVVDDRDAYARMGPAEKEAIKVRLRVLRLAERNRQLDKMLNIIASLVHANDIDDIKDDSTSLLWIRQYLQRRYNIETKGVNFLRIAQINFKAGSDAQVFYKEFRSAFVENLRKAGDANHHLKPGSTLAADEVMSPTLEDSIVLWTLEKIDPRLPAKVAKVYEHRLDKDTHLIDLHVSIFQYVPSLLQDLDRDAGLNALAAGCTPLTMEDGTPVTGNAFSAGFGGKGRVPYGKGRGGKGGKARSHPTISPLTGRTWTTKLCRICHDKDKSPAVVASHDTAECDSLSNSDRRRMLASLQAMDLTTGNDYDAEAAEFDEETLTNQEEQTAQGLQGTQSLPS